MTSTENQGVQNSQLAVVCPKCKAYYRTQLACCPRDGQTLISSAQDPLIGTTLGDFIVEAFLGEGATGRVYKARHQRLERRKVAIKVMLGDMAMHAQMRMRFAQEAEIASRLNHPNVVSVLDFGASDNGLVYLVMEFVKGRTLLDLIEASGYLKTESTICLSRQMCHGLAHAHNEGLVHRDFKPDNVALQENASGVTARILDFGLAIETGEGASARLTTAGQVVGTPAYLAPEQWQQGHVDHRADLFALGVAMYEMLTGKIPFDGPIPEIARATLTETAPSISERTNGEHLVLPELESIINRLMEKRAEDRFQSATEVVDALDALAFSNTSVGVQLAESYAKSGLSVPATDSDMGIVNPRPVSAVAATGLQNAPTLPVAHLQSAQTPQPATPLQPATPALPANRPQPTQKKRGIAPLAITAAIVLLVAGTFAIPAFRNSSTQQTAPAETAPSPLSTQQVSVRSEKKVTPTAAPLRNSPPAATQPSVDTPKNLPVVTPPTVLEKKAEVKEASNSRKRSRRSTKRQRTSSKRDEPPPAIAPQEKSKPSTADPKKQTAMTPSKKKKPAVAPKVVQPLNFNAAVSIKSLSSRGSLPTREIQRALDRVKAQFKSCYEKTAKKAGVSPAVSSSVSFVIDETARATSITVSGAPVPGLSACVKNAVSGVRTRSAPDVGTVKASFTIAFKP